MKTKTKQKSIILFFIFLGFLSCTKVKQGCDNSNLQTNSDSITTKDSLVLPKGAYPIWLDEGNRIIAKFLVNDSIEATAFIETGTQNTSFSESFIRKLNMVLDSSITFTSNYAASQNERIRYRTQDSIKINDRYFGKGVRVRSSGGVNADMDIEFPLVDFSEIVELNIKGGYLKKLDREELDSICLEENVFSFDMRGTRYEFFSIEAKLEVFDTLGIKEEIFGSFLLDTGSAMPVVIHLNSAEGRSFFQKTERMELRDTARIKNPGYPQLKVLETDKVRLFENICISNIDYIFGIGSGLDNYFKRHNIIGLLGAPLYKDFIVIFDYDRKKLYLKPNNDAAIMICENN